MVTWWKSQQARFLTRIPVGSDLSEAAKLAQKSVNTFVHWILTVLSRLDAKSLKKRPKLPIFLLTVFPMRFGTL